MASFNIKLALLIFGLFIATVQSVEKSQFKLTSRIVNGLDAKRGQFPYFASLVDSKNFQHHCGGAIISRYHIITAAHCTSRLQSEPSSILAVLGITNPVEDNAIVAKIKKIVQHPAFIKELLFNDIAILKTVNEIQFTKFVQPVALAESNIKVAGGQISILCGLGAMNHALPEDRILPKVLQYQETKTLSIRDCKAKYENLVIGNRKTWERVTAMLSGKTFCALKDNGFGPCRGDSGGPLVSNNTLIGVVSASIGCALGYPDLYTNIFEHKLWIINEVTKNMLDDEFPGNLVEFFN